MSTKLNISSNIKFESESLNDLEYKWICYKHNDKYCASLFTVENSQKYLVKDFKGDDIASLKCNAGQFFSQDYFDSKTMIKIMGYLSEECYFSFHYPINQ